MLWAKTRPSARYDLAVSNVRGCSIDDLEGARETVAFTGRNDNGYGPLIDAIAAAFGVAPEQVTTASGAAGANFHACAALLAPGDDVVVERPGYDPLLGAPRLLGARTIRFDRTFDGRFDVDPDRVAAAVTPRTRLIIVTRPHNPTGAVASQEAIAALGPIAERTDAHVLVDEVYLDAVASGGVPAARLGERFISTSSLTKSYGLAGLRCGWTISSPAIAERIRRARDVIDGSGSIVTERLATLAFAHRDGLLARADGILTTNGTKLRTFLSSRPELEWIDPGGGTILFPRIRGVPDTAIFANRLLNEWQTAIVPGHFFEAPAHFRLGIGATPESIDGGIAALAAALDSRAWTA